MPRGKKFTAEQIIGKLREAERGAAEISMLVPGCWFSKRLPRGRWGSYG
jgi:hypothetical protein